VPISGRFIDDSSNLGYAFCVYPHARILAFAAVLAFSASTSGFAQPAPQIVPLNSPQLWQRLEFNITNVPAFGNPFDPDSIRLDATFTLPSGQTTTVPAFWYQAYRRSLSGGYESDAPTGAPGCGFATHRPRAAAIRFPSPFGRMTRFPARRFWQTSACQRMCRRPASVTPASRRAGNIFKPVTASP